MSAEREWRTRRVKDIARTFAGGTPSRSKPEYFGGSMPWLKSGELHFGRLSRTEESITEVALRETSARVATAGTPVIAMYGAVINQTRRVKQGILERLLKKGI